MPSPAGKKLPAALYGLSVLPSQGPEDDALLFQEMNDVLQVNMVLSSEKLEVISWDRVLEATVQDSALVKLTEMIYRGFPQNS